MNLLDAISKIAEPIIKDAGLVLAGVTLNTDKGTVVQVLLENADGTGANIDACTSVSRTLGYTLEVEETVQEAYTLEVSSPGLSRPLFSLKDIERFVGKNAKVKLFTEVAEKKAHSGVLGAVEGKAFKLLTDADGEVLIQWDDIKTARLNPSDAEIQAIMKQSKTA